MQIDLSFARAKLVLPANFNHVEFWQVGAGGTGSFCAMNLARLCFELRLRQKSAALTIVDPDVVEENNIPRSNFCFAEIGLNKAETLARRISAAWGMETGFFKEGFRPALLRGKTSGWNNRAQEKLTIIVGCVDNHLARKQMHEAVKYHNESSYDSSAPRLWWIDGGNGRASGQVLIGNRLSEKDIYESSAKSPILSLLPAPSLQHPELLEQAEQASVAAIPIAETDAMTSCAERIRLGEQSLNVNQRVALEMAEMLTELVLANNLKRFATYFDLESGASRSQYNTLEALASAMRLRPAKKRKRAKSPTTAA
jgi:PRTRC genetic system ThiF family protein